MKDKALKITFFFLLMSSLLFSGQKVKEKDLTQKYRDFLRHTDYIILPEEKEVFMQLTKDRDRDIFINNFWKVRDPTPGTSENEYKDEQIRRFTYANKNLGRNTPKEGWSTDMGRIYIILGEPVSKERFWASQGIYPCEVWYYYGDKKKGLPTHFGLVFFQRGGAGEYKLYNPVSDGPASLLIDSKNMDPFNYYALYDKVREFAPSLAPVCLSLVPGDIPVGYQPSPQNAIILADIIESPKKDIKPTYATHFLDYIGMVSTGYMTNYIENETGFAFIQDPIMGINFLHFSIAPKSISIDYYEPKDQYFCNFTLDVSLRIEKNIIFQYTRNFPFYFDPEDLDKVKNNGIAIEDSFPFIAGSYKLVILLQNSVGKEFSIFEKELSFPEESELPQISIPLFGYRFQDFRSDLHIPFKVMGKKLLVDPKKTFSSSDNISFVFNVSNLTRGLWEEGKINVFVKGLKPNNPSEKSLILKLSDYPFKKILPVTHTIAAGELSSDYYEMKVDLIDKNGEKIDEINGNFVISAQTAVSHPIARSKAVPLSNNYLYFYMLASQYEKVKKMEKAESFYEKAYRVKPDYKKGLIDYTYFLIRIGKFKKSLELIENIKEDEKLRFEYYLARGKAYTGMGLYSEAIKNLIEGNKVYDSDIGLLNSLGFCYARTGERQKALDVLKSSLALNPEQENIKKLIAEIEKK